MNKVHDPKEVNLHDINAGRDVVLNQTIIHPDHVAMLKVPTDLDIAQDVITYFEHRYTLVGPLFKNCPGGVVQFLTSTKRELEKEMRKIDRQTELFKRLSHIQKLISTFWDEICGECGTSFYGSSCKNCIIYKSGCADKFLEFREQTGQEIEEIVRFYKIEIESESNLRKILPGYAAKYGDERAKDISTEVVQSLISAVPNIKKLSFTHPDFQYWSKAVKAVMLLIYGDTSTEFDDFKKIIVAKPNGSAKEVSVIFRDSCNQMKILLEHSLGSLG